MRAVLPILIGLTLVITAVNAWLAIDIRRRQKRAGRDREQRALGQQQQQQHVKPWLPVNHGQPPASHL